jgi:hypothetical protein
MGPRTKFNRHTHVLVMPKFGERNRSLKEGRSAWATKTTPSYDYNHKYEY